MNSLATCASCLLVVLSTCVVLDAQLIFGAVPVGTISRLSANGEREVISSSGGAKVGIYRKTYPPHQPLYVVPRYPPIVPRYPPVPVVKTPKPGYPTKKPGPTSKPGVTVTGRVGGAVLGGLLGALGGKLGGLFGR